MLPACDVFIMVEFFFYVCVSFPLMSWQLYQFLIIGFTSAFNRFAFNLTVIIRNANIQNVFFLFNMNKILIILNERDNNL